MESNTGLTASDVALMTKNNDGFLEGNGIIILILFFLIFAGGGIFGGNSNAVTQAELQAGLYNQTTDRNLTDISAAIANLNQSILTTGASTDKEILQNRYDSQLASANTNSMMQSCCCENRLAIANQTNELTAQMTANTQAILDKLCSQEIQNLRDEVAGYRDTLSNANQTQNLLNAIGTWRANPPFPYYGTYGSYGSYSGTTIY